VESKEDVVKATDSGKNKLAIQSVGRSKYIIYLQLQLTVSQIFKQKEFKLKIEIMFMKRQMIPNTYAASKFKAYDASHYYKHGNSLRLRVNQELFTKVLKTSLSSWNSLNIILRLR